MLNTLFIGREEACKRLKKDVFLVEDSSYGRCYSLIGPNGIGKTTLAKHLAEEFKKVSPSNTYYFSTVLEENSSFYSFWTSLVLSFYEEININELERTPRYDERLVKKITEIYLFFNENIGNIDNDNRRMGIANRHLNRIFQYFTELGIRIIITIDEFDRASSIFKNSHFYERLFGLTSKGAADLNLSIITISRKSISTIVANLMPEGSSLEDAYPPYPLRGFINDEMEEYFSTYGEIGVEKLPADIKQQIVYVCGRHPGLLMHLRHEIELTDEKENISFFNSKYWAILEATYKRLCTLLSTEYVDQQKEISCMSVFIQKFIGPAYMDNLDEKVEKLYNLGLITKCQQNEKNIFELSGMKEYRDKGNLEYEPLSPHFVEYIKHFYMPHDLNSLEGLLRNVEIEIRNLILNVFTKVYPENWKYEIEKICPQKVGFYNSLRQTAADNEAEIRGLFFSMLDVLSFKEYKMILEKPEFNNYLSVLIKDKDFNDDMTMLYDCRNSSDHRNLRVLNKENRDRLRTTCERVLDNIKYAMESFNKEQGKTDVVIEARIESAKTYTLYDLKPKNHKLRGKIIDPDNVLNDVIASIPKTALEKRDIKDLKEFIQKYKTIQVVLKKLDDNPNRHEIMYIADFADHLE